MKSKHKEHMIRLIDADKLLEWIKTKQHNYPSYCIISEYDKMETKVKSLIAEPTDAENTTIDPSDWREGDRVVDDRITGSNRLYEIKHIDKGIASFTCKSNYPTSTHIEALDSVKKYSTNIDAELRAKDAEIANLKIRSEALNNILIDKQKERE